MLKIAIPSLITAIFLTTSLPIPAMADDLAAKVHALGKIEANIWETAAAVFFHIADHDRESQKTTAVDVTHDETSIGKQIVNLETMNLSKEEAVRFAKIKQHWNTLRTKADALMSIDFADEKKLEAEDSHLHGYWHATSNLDEEIDAFIESLTGKR